MFCISDVESDIRQAAKVANEGEERNMKDALAESLREMYGLRKQEREIERERERQRQERQKKRNRQAERERERGKEREKRDGEGQNLAYYTNFTQNFVAFIIIQLV